MKKVNNVSNRLFFSLMISFSLWGISMVIYYSNFRYPRHLSYSKYYGFTGAAILFSSCILIGLLFYFLFGLVKKNIQTKPSLFSETKYSERLETCKKIGNFWANISMGLYKDGNIIYVPLIFIALPLSLIFFAPITYLLSAFYFLLFVLPEHLKFQDGLSKEAKPNFFSVFLKFGPFFAAGYHFFLLNTRDLDLFEIYLLHETSENFGKGVLFSIIRILNLSQGNILTLCAVFLAVISLFAKRILKYAVGACWIILSLIFILPPLILYTQLPLSTHIQAVWFAVEIGLVICGAVFFIVGGTMLIDRKN